MMSPTPTGFAHRVVVQAMENGRVDHIFAIELRQIRSMAINRATRKVTSTPRSTSPNPTKPWKHLDNLEHSRKKSLCRFSKG